MAKKEFSDVERQEYDDEFPREVTPIPYGGKSTSTSLQAEPSTPTLKPEIDQLHHFTTTPCATSPLRKNSFTWYSALYTNIDYISTRPKGYISNDNCHISKIHLPGILHCVLTLTISVHGPKGVCQMIIVIWGTPMNPQ